MLCTGGGRLGHMNSGIPGIRATDMWSYLCSQCIHGTACSALVLMYHSPGMLQVVDEQQGPDHQAGVRHCDRARGGRPDRARGRLPGPPAGQRRGSWARPRSRPCSASSPAWSRASRSTRRSSPASRCHDDRLWLSTLRKGACLGGLGLPQGRPLQSSAYLRGSLLHRA